MRVPLPVAFLLSVVCSGLASCNTGGTENAPSEERVAASSLASLAPPAARANGRRAFEIADFYRCASLSGLALAPDGSRAAVAVRRFDLEGGRSWSEIWLVPLDGADPRRMTFGEHADGNPSFSPDGKTLLFTSDREGGGQLWTLPLAGGEAKQLTDFGPGLSDPVWSPDGKWIAATSELWPECGLDTDCHERNRKGVEEGKTQVRAADELLYRHWTSWPQGKRTHVLLVDAASGEVVRDLTSGPHDAPTFQLGGGRGFAFSPDSKELCFVSNHDAKQAESTNADLWAVPVAGGLGEGAPPRCLTDANDGWDGMPAYSPDGRWIAYVSQETAKNEADLKRLVLLERSSNKVRALTSREGFDDMVADFRWSADSKRIVFEAENRGRTPLYEIALADGKPRELLRHGTLGGFELAPGEGEGDRIVHVARKIDAPAEVYVARADGSEPRALTRFHDAFVDEVDVRPAAEFEVEGEAGYGIHGFLVTPHGFDPTKRYPLILNVHGGPQSQWTDAFRGDWQVYPGKGYLVAFCNPTGSTGYGQDYCDAIRGDYGGRVYRDLMRVADELAALPYVDRERMGLMGWSYGGYMSMWVEGHTERFAANAAMMGLYDLRSFYGATEELWFPEWDMHGTPWTSEHYDRWSPSNHVQHFKTPALVVSGELDYRVPYTQSLQYFTALQKMGVPSRLVILPQAGHWPAWHEMAVYYNEHLAFFHRWLGGEPAPWDVTEHARNLAFEKQTEAAAPDEP